MWPMKIKFRAARSEQARLRAESENQSLDCIQVLILDDIGYVQHRREEIEAGSLAWANCMDAAR